MNNETIKLVKVAQEEALTRPTGPNDGTTRGKELAREIETSKIKDIKTRQQSEAESQKSA